MWQQTGRLARIWFRLTVVLAAALTVVGIAYGLDSTPFVVAAVVAVAAELLVVRALCREWAWQARGCWWRFW